MWMLCPLWYCVTAPLLHSSDRVMLFFRLNCGHLWSVLYISKLLWLIPLPLSLSLALPLPSLEKDWDLIKIDLFIYVLWSFLINCLDFLLFSHCGNWPAQVTSMTAFHVNGWGRGGGVRQGEMLSGLEMWAPTLSLTASICPLLFCFTGATLLSLLLRYEKE